MTMPTPAPTPDPNDTAKAEDENPAFGGRDTHFSEEERAPEDVSPTQDASKGEESGKLYDTDKNS